MDTGQYGRDNSQALDGEIPSCHCHQNIGHCWGVSLSSHTALALALLCTTLHWHCLGPSAAATCVVSHRPLPCCTIHCPAALYTATYLLTLHRIYYRNNNNHPLLLTKCKCVSTNKMFNLQSNWINNLGDIQFYSLISMISYIFIEIPCRNLWNIIWVYSMF